MWGCVPLTPMQMRCTLLKTGGVAFRHTSVIEDVMLTPFTERARVTG